jgi:hypothetical protein
MSKKRLRIEELGPERLPLRPRAATTNRPISEESRRIITAAQAEAIRRARRR